LDIRQGTQRRGGPGPKATPTKGVGAGSKALNLARRTTPLDAPPREDRCSHFGVGCCAPLPSGVAMPGAMALFSNQQLQLVMKPFSISTPHRYVKLLFFLKMLCRVQSVSLEFGVTPALACKAQSHASAMRTRHAPHNMKKLIAHGTSHTHGNQCARSVQLWFRPREQVSNSPS